MNEREQEIVKAAIGIFTRYGVKKTTMGDIASEIGISRQTLYASYANKEEILAAAVKHSLEEILQNMRQSWASLDTVSEKLDSYFEIAIFPYFDLLRSAPDFDDLMNGFNTAGKVEKERGSIEKKKLFQSLFSPYQHKLDATNTTPEDLADLLCSSSENFLYTANDRTHLEKLVNSLKMAILALLGEVS